MGNDSYSTTLFACPFTSFPVSSTGGASYFDLWSITGTTVGRTEIHEIQIGQLSTQVTGNQQIAIQIMRGSTALGGGATIIPVNLKGWGTAPTAGSSAEGPSSVLASTISATVIYADNTNYSGGWFYSPASYEEIVLDTGQTMNIRVSAPPVTVQLSGTLLIREVTKQK